MFETHEGEGVPEAISDWGDEPERSGALKLGQTMAGTRLRVLERLSDGASGVVFRAEHVDLERPIAVKILRRVVRSDEDRERFLAEARLATSIDSPHVVDVIDFGQLPDGRLWYAMELLDGEALCDVLFRERRLPLARVFTLLRMACKGLGATHARGMVHCDVKPQNLVLVQRGRYEQLVVVDFGIAQAIGSRPGTICGTPEYISPEQIEKNELDPRTDVYALGCCAYEMLTGRLLIDDGCTVERAVARHLDGIEEGLVFPPEAKVPAPVEALVRRCLARDPARRPASMAELEAELCEAQIECRVSPTREDLELPDVDRARRDGIAIGFAGMLAPRRAAWLERSVFGAAMTAMAATALAVLVVHADAEPIAQRFEVSPAATVRGSEAALLATAIDPPALAHAVTPMPVADAFAPEPIATPEPIPTPGPITTPAVVPPAKSTRPSKPRPREAVKSRDELRDDKQLAARDVRRDPSSAQARLRLGDALHRLGRSQAAARQYRAAARLGSRTAERRLQTIARD